MRTSIRSPLLALIFSTGIFAAGRLACKIALTIAAISLAPSCANVTFHSDAALKKQTGLKYYTAKPYILIGPTGNKDAPMKAEIISLPDLENPTYAKYHPGWGSHNFSLAVASSGNLSSYGQTADSKGPETIAALSGLVTSAATMTSAVKAATTATAAAGGGSKGFISSTSTTAESAVVNDVRQAINQLQNISAIPEEAGLVALNRPVAEKLIDALNEWLKPKSPLDQPDPESGLAQISENIKSKMIPDATHVAAAVAINSCYDKAKKHVDSAIKAIESGKPPKQDFKLFEIKMEAGRTRLIQADTKLAEAVIRNWQYNQQ